MPTPGEEELKEAFAELADPAKREAAWRVLYRHLRPLVFATCFRVLRGDRHWAEDVTQETFFKVDQHFKLFSYSPLRFGGPAALRAYAHRVARTTAIDFLRRLHGRRVPHMEHPLDLEPEPVDARASSPGQRLEANESLGRLFAELDEAELELLSLVLDGHSQRDLPVLMGLSYQVVANRLHRLRDRLRKIRQERNL